MRTVAVLGGTGAMGAAVARRLAHDGVRVVVPTRDAESDRARAVGAVAGVELVVGELADDAWIRGVFGTVDAVFANTNFFADDDALAEHRLGVALLEQARLADVGRFVWSSLDSALALTDGEIAVPHYDAKAAVAATINLRRTDEFMRRDAGGWYSTHVAVLTTAPYFENLLGPLHPVPAELADGREGLRFDLPFGTARYPLIALDDIAWFAQHLLGEPRPRDLAVVGEALTGAEIATTFEAITGIPSEHRDLPLETVEASLPGIGHDLAAMCAFFQAVDLTARARDLPALLRLHPDLLSFAQWLRGTGWRGGLG